MGDKSRIVSGLKSCRMRPLYCNSTCPYFEKKDCTNKLADDVLEMLEEQKPKAVQAYIEKGIPNAIQFIIHAGDTVYCCPKCGKNLSVNQKRKYCRYCESCGQALDWE